MSTTQPAANDIREQSAWSCDTDKLFTRYQTNAVHGLSGSEVAERHARYGYNRIEKAKSRSLVAILADQFKSVVVLLLVGASVVAFLFADYAEAIAVLLVVVINAAIGFVTMWRATRSMESLSKLGKVDTTVIREGMTNKVPADDLVTGDIVLIDSGDIVTADIRLFDVAQLRVDESMLTGESLPVAKQIEPIAADAAAMDRRNMLFKGTAVTRGTAKGIVVTIGQNTEVGRISALAHSEKELLTPLERRLNKLGTRLAVVVLVFAVLLAIGGVFVGREPYVAIQVAIALAVAAIPEGLPLVATLSLARGMWRMAKRNALINRLAAVETLGATNYIVTDKTGTLTENKMTVATVQTADETYDLGAPDITIATNEQAPGQPRVTDKTAPFIELLNAAVLCNNASIRTAADGKQTTLGDPTELALVAAALQHGVSCEALQAQLPRINEVPFDPESRLMATLHTHNEGVLVVVKGAPEAVIPLCDFETRQSAQVPMQEHRREEWIADAGELGAHGLRTLAVASKLVAGNGCEEPFGKLVMLGILGMEDPARKGVKAAIERCQKAGITVIMVTGDHLATARNIATELGLISPAAGPASAVNGKEIDRWLAASPSAQSGAQKLTEARIFARATPEQKLKLIDLYQRQGGVVAMTGDGVNDAPALKKADIGIAMGIRGTAVAKEAADIVLQDDEFETIVEAVAQGRAIYINIRKFCIYLLSCNISELLVVSLATVAGAPLPLLPLQILFLNLVTDVFPALALGVGEGAPGVMRNRPRSASEPLLTPGHWWRIGLHGLVICAATLGSMFIAITWLHFDSTKAVTVSFCTLALAQLWHVFNMRESLRPVLLNEITRNPWIWIAVVLCLGLIAAAIYTPVMSSVLGLTHPGARGWMVIVSMSLLPLLLAPLIRFVSHQD